MTELKAIKPPVPLVIACDIIEKLSSFDISACNGSYQTLVVNKILETGKALDDLTVRELIAIKDEASTEFETLSPYRLINEFLQQSNRNANVSD